MNVAPPAKATLMVVLVLIGCTPPQSTTRPIDTRIAPAVVIIARRVDGRIERNGSGVVVHPSGRVLTAFHVVGFRVPERESAIGATKSEGELVVGITDPHTNARRFLGARVLRTDVRRDLALLELTSAAPAGGWPHLSPRTSAPRVGDEVCVWGWPFGPQIVSVGPIAALRRDRAGRPSIIAVPATAYPGSSGGAITDVDGRLIALPLAVSTPWEHANPLVMARSVMQVPETWWSASSEQRLDRVPELVPGRAVDVSVDTLDYAEDEAIYFRVSHAQNGVVRSEPAVVLFIVDGYDRFRGGQGEVASLAGDPENSALVAIVPESIERLRLTLVPEEPGPDHLPRQTMSFEVLLSPERRENVRYVLRSRTNAVLAQGEAAPGVPFDIEDIVLGSAARIEVRSGSSCVMRELRASSSGVTTINLRDGIAVNARAQASHSAETRRCRPN